MIESTTYIENFLNDSARNSRLELHLMEIFLGTVYEDEYYYFYYLIFQSFILVLFLLFLFLLFCAPSSFHIFCNSSSFNVFTFLFIVLSCFFFNFLVLFMQHYILLWMLSVKLFCISFGYTSLVGDIFSIDIVELYRTIQKMPPELNCELLLPIWTAEIIECVCKYTGRISQNLQSLSPY